MKNKKEAIKLAYKEYWNIVYGFVNEEGWLDIFGIEGVYELSTIKHYLDLEAHPNHTNLYRPKQLNK